MFYSPGKHYLVALDEDEGVCSVSPFQIENVTQSMGELYGFGNGGPLFGEPRVRIEGQLHGNTRILKAVDLDNISYEEIMNLIGEQNG